MTTTESQKTFVKADMAEEIVRKVKLTKQVAKELVEQLFEEIRARLEAGEPVKISKFGNFDLRDKKARPGRNPKTGEEKVIHARRVVTFRGGQKLKALVEQGQQPRS
jgi:integration host factor subunit alpha